MLATRDHDPALVPRIPEQMAAGVMRGTHAAEKAHGLPAEWRAAMGPRSGAGWAACRAAMPDDPEFLRFWQQATWIDEISHLKFGSRPSFAGPRRAWRTCVRFRGVVRDAKPLQFPGLVRPRKRARGAGRGAQGRTRWREMQAGGPFFPTMIDLARRTMRQADPGVAALRAARRGRTGLAAHLRPARGGVCPRAGGDSRGEGAGTAVRGQAGGAAVVGAAESFPPLNDRQVGRLRRRRSGKEPSVEETEAARP